MDSQVTDPQSRGVRGWSGGRDCFRVGLDRRAEGAYMSCLEEDIVLLVFLKNLTDYLKAREKEQCKLRKRVASLSAGSSSVQSSLPPSSPAPAEDSPGSR